MLLADLPDPGLARVAEETGGGYIEIRFGQDLGAAFARVADELHTQYLLGFAPPKRDGKVHDIDVRVTQGGTEAARAKELRRAEGIGAAVLIPAGLAVPLLAEGTARPVSVVERSGRPHPAGVVGVDLGVGGVRERTRVAGEPRLLPTRAG